MKKILRAVEHRLPLGAFIFRHLCAYQVPSSLNIWYVFGMLALVFLGLQFISGLALLMYYMPSVQDAFASIQMLMRDIPSAWYIRYLHSTGASFIFFVLYAHIFRSFLYGSYRQPRELVWGLGCLLWQALMFEAFMGYVLPWGQMSYWGAEVMTEALAAIPYIGPSLTYVLKGGYQVGQALLQRCFAFHILALPVVLFFLIKLHIIAVRCVGSSEPVELPSAKIPFYPDHVLKELLPMTVVLTLFLAAVFFCPEYFIEAGNYIPANPLQTPALIHPPWYIAAYYSILRAIPNLFMGLSLTLLALMLWFFLPFLDKSDERLLRKKSRLFQLFLMSFCVSFIALIALSFVEWTAIYLNLARLFTAVYFSFFLLMPWYSRCKK